MIEVSNLTKIYDGGAPVTALNEVSLILPDNGMVFLLGRSGSGKTTLLNLLGGLDGFQSGDITVDGISLKQLDGRRLDAYRNSYIGFVFQEYNLLDELSVGENIAFATELQKKAVDPEDVEKVLSAVGMDGCEDRKPSELSGGQKQRVAIARALIKKPVLLLADEPTGALDTDNSRQVFDILKSLSKERLVVVVTHDRDYADEYADRIIELADGRVISDSAPIKSNGSSENNNASDEKPAGLPPRIARKMAFNTVKSKKLRFAMVVLLSVTAFLLVGLADTFSGYSYNDALLRSLYEERQKSVALCKQQLCDYGEGEDWYGDGFRMKDDETAALSQKLGRNVKGVYVPPKSLNIEGNYRSKEVTNRNFSRYVAELSGFTEIGENELSDFGIELISGRMPNATKDEVALSRYVLESFENAGYSEYTGPRYTVFNDDGSESEYSFDEWLENYGEGMPFFSNYTVEQLTYKEKAPEYTVTGAEDLIGKTVFIGDRNYTVTGIVDTHFDYDRYADTKMLDSDDSGSNDLGEWIKSRQFDTERSYGLCSLAFVGKGKVKEIAGRYPSTVYVHGGKIKLENDYLKMTTSVIAGLGDLGEAAKGVYCQGFVDENGFPQQKLPESLKDGEFIAPFELRNPAGKDTKTVAAINSGRAFEEFKMSFISDDGENSWSSAGYSMIGNLDWWNYYGSEIYDVQDLLVVSDSTLEKLSEGRGGMYGFAVVSLPQSKAELRELINKCSDFGGNVRYSAVNAATSQMDAMNGTIATATGLLRYVGLALTVFAALLMFQFISVSIASRKRQIGIMRALGAGGRDVFRIFLYEGLLAASVNAVVSCAAVFAFSLLVNRILAARYSLMFSLLNPGVRQIVLLVVLSFAVAFVSCYGLIHRISKQRPVDVIRQ